MSRAYTAEELREILLAHVRKMAHYWSKLPDLTPLERCYGTAFSILAALDGSAGSVPFSVDLVASVHPDDKQYRIDEGDNWVEPGTVLNVDCHLHDLFYKPEEKKS